MKLSKIIDKISKYFKKDRLKNSQEEKVLKLIEELKEKKVDVKKEIKELKLKVQASIRGDVVRVEGKSIDDLQEAIKAIRGCDFDFPVNFTNLK